jgi:FixJ family two-component response regulator
LSAGNTTDQQLRSDAGSAAPPVVFIVDDDVSVRESLDALVRHSGLQAETFPSARSFLARSVVTGPSCLILDVHLPDLSGLDLQALVATDRIDMPIIFISGQGDVPMTVRAMKAGAVEFLTKPLQSEALLRSIKSALSQSQAALARAMALRTLRESYASLTLREREVMSLVVSGQLNKQVGGALGISEITVKAHRGKMMRKMNADSLADLVTMAAALGIAPPEGR